MNPLTPSCDHWFLNDPQVRKLIQPATWKGGSRPRLVGTARTLIIAIRVSLFEGLGPLRLVRLLRPARDPPPARPDRRPRPGRL